jgi:uncharacterized protein YcfJ
MNTVWKLAMTSALALAAAAPAAAQYGPSYPYGAPYIPVPAYGQQPNPYYGAPPSGPTYGAPQPGYGAPAPYGGAPGTYGAAPGAYPPSGYGPPPGAYAPPPAAYGAPPAAAYGANTAYAAAPVKCDNTGAIAGGLIGALAGGVLGSNVAGHGNKTEGTVLGGLVGGGLGAAVGHAHDKHQCDERGVVYYNYGDTLPYQVDSSADPRAAEYVNRGCRMAPAAVNNSQEVRYVRVCPDPDGRYRIVG